MSFQSWFYHSLFYFHAAVTFLEFSLTLALIIAVFFVKHDAFFKADSDEFDWDSVDANTRTIIIVLFIIGAVRTAILFTVIFLVIFLAFPCCFFLMAECCRRRVLNFIKAEATHRFFSFNCNCPCFRPRPKLRFQLQLAFLIVIFCIRIANIILCLTTSHHIISKNFAVIIAISFYFLILTSLLDYYHYHVWWHYEPDLTKKKLEIPDTPLSKKHLRYLPYALLGNHRTGKVGDKLCIEEPCTNRRLEHILIFHLSDYQPQPRWSKLKELNPAADTYIGFHRTTAQSAVFISHSDFRRSTTPPQMLGFGVYFARSIKNTLGKARFEGAIIAAELRMGKVKEVTKNELFTVKNTDSWHPEFDTVYYNHADDARDEFCVYNETQILKWIVVIDQAFDGKIKNYDMANEFSDTRCFCI